MQETKVILITGKKRSGKDYIACKLAKEWEDVEILHFADALKSIVATTLGISKERLELGKNIDKNSSVVITTEDGSKITRSFRQMLQIFGTEAMKPIFGDNIWAKIVKHKIYNTKAKIVIIPDWRFVEEYKEIVQNFPTTTIVVLGGGIEDDLHSSETALDWFKTDFVFNNKNQPIFDIKNLEKTGDTIVSG